MTDLAVTPTDAIYTISFSALYRVDATTGAATFVMTVAGSSNNGMTFLSDGTLLAVDQAGTVKHLDPTAGSVTIVGSFGSGYTSSGDLVAVSDGTLYGISATLAGGGDASSDNVLVRVDPATGTATAVGPIGFGNVWGLAYYGATVLAFTDSGQVVRIDPSTGAGTLVANSGLGYWGAGVSPLVSATCP